MFIKVTTKHITNGNRVSPLYCPIALAIKDVVKINAAHDVSVGATYCFIKDREWHLPESAQKFISKFDGYKKVEPFEFELID